MKEMQKEKYYYVNFKDSFQKILSIGIMTWKEMTVYNWCKEYIICAHKLNAFLKETKSNTFSHKALVYMHFSIKALVYMHFSIKALGKMHFQQKHNLMHLHI